MILLESAQPIGKTRSACAFEGRWFFLAESNYSGEEQESLLNVLYRRKVSPSSAACLIYSALHCKSMHLTLSSCFLTHLAPFLTL